MGNFQKWNTLGLSDFLLFYYILVNLIAYFLTALAGLPGPRVLPRGKALCLAEWLLRFWPACFSGIIPQLVCLSSAHMLRQNETDPASFDVTAVTTIYFASVGLAFFLFPQRTFPNICISSFKMCLVSVEEWLNKL